MREGMARVCGSRNLVALVVLSGALGLLGSRVAERTGSAVESKLERAAVISSGMNSEAAGKCPELFIRAATVSLKRY